MRSRDRGELPKQRVFEELFGEHLLDSLPEAVAAAARVFRGDPTPRAYVCVGETCAPPTTDPAAVADLVRTYGLRDGRLLF